MSQTPHDPDATLITGLKINSTFDGKYIIIAKIDDGGMGKVYRALDTTAKGEQVAIKVLRPDLADDPQMRQRLEQEAYSCLYINHPNVVRVFDSKQSTAERPAYIVMELLEGETLGHLLRREGPLDLKRAAALMREICDGVGAGHRAGIVHRDLKPGNVMVLSPSCRAAAGVRLKVMDFGIAKLRFMSDVISLTQPGQVMGTPRYMLPEQWDGHEEGPRTDVYSLGVMFYEMICGVPPFIAGDVAGLERSHRDDEPPPLRAALKLPHVEAVIRRALEKAPGLRQADAVEFIEQLEKAVQADARYSFPRPIMIGIAATAAVCLLAAWLISTWKTTVLPLRGEIELQPVMFETVELDGPDRGSKRYKGEAQFFRENLGDGVTLDMVKVQGGAFMMGSPPAEKGRRPDEEHKAVTVPTFYIGKFEITQAQWRAVASAPKVERELRAEPEGFRGGDLPVNNVSWFDAIEFCARLSRMTGREYRLPTEAEWEYACRAGSDKPFTFGETITKGIANFHGETAHDGQREDELHPTIMPVGSMGVANRFGLYDMHGNLQEWCQDEKQVKGNEFRALRGGGWGTMREKCRCAFRDWGRPGNGQDIFGFRVIWVPDAK